MPVETQDIDLGWKKIVKETKKLDNSYTDVGLFSTGGDPSKNIAARATVHEFGSPKMKIPSRPFMRKTFKDHKTETIKVANIQYKKILNGLSNARRLLKVLGAFYSGKMRQTVTTGGFRPLKMKTILKKKSSVPLIDTGQLRSSITHKESIR